VISAAGSRQVEGIMASNAECMMADMGRWADMWLMLIRRCAGRCYET
jgi:hypothetical protein